ncbi:MULTISPECIES: MSCRAMM family protein [Paenibacillus]|uniref:MSCRAMM family protein n=1 Tax=Paenibacillus TaxID=44249 RepID=UPI0022B89601|nr:carboxypeptidase-like regulatory domain-containing protein [Paenibacillus caseinilyticus]MCZ8518414.1 carboxypeptidase-like regulatory domain-containing protein [Paenibacillus caseinilyticus]
MAITDRYTLHPSPLISLSGRDAESVNMLLEPAPDSDSGNVSGIVRLSNGDPVDSATVMLYTQSGIPFEHTNSNAVGRFIFPRVPVGSYFITATEPSYLTPNRISLSVIRNRSTEVDIIMQTDPNGQKNAIFGTLRATVGGAAIQDATVELYQVIGTTPQLVGIVSTNAEGQYLIADLNPGTFFITASKAGYLSSQSAPSTLQNRDYAPLDLILAADPDALTGTISGVIAESGTGSPIPDAIVALYAINNGSESIVDITRTNAGGFYGFGDLISGTYRIKATVQVQT